MSKTHSKHLHLLPILSIVPLLSALLAVSKLNLYLDPLILGFIAISYLAINVIYCSLHGHLSIGYTVEYSLLALIAYFVLTLYS